MSPERRTSIDDSAFDYRTRKDGTVEISYHHRPVTTLRGNDAAKFLSRIANANESETQHLMARATGNFKRGNEKRKKR